MPKRVQVLCICIFIILLNSRLIPYAVAQDSNKIDSLENVLKTAREDTGKVKTLIALSSQISISNQNEKALKFANTALSLAEKLKYKKGIADSYGQIGIIFKNQGKYQEALENHLAALKIVNETGDKKGIATSYTNIGVTYYNQDNYPEALKNHLIALKIRKEINDQSGMADSYNHIGNAYNRQGNFPEALKYHFASLKIKEELGDQKGMSYSYLNIGLIYSNQDNYPEAMNNYNNAIKISKEINDQNIIASSYNNIGIIYHKQGNYREALNNYLEALHIRIALGDKRKTSDAYNNIGNTYKVQGNIFKNQGDTVQANKFYADALKSFFEALKIKEEFGNKAGIGACYTNIGLTYTTLHKYEEARTFLNKGLELARETGHREYMKNTYSGLATLDSALGTSDLLPVEDKINYWKSAFYNYKIYSEISDSMLNSESNQQIAEMKVRYETEKKDKEIELLNKENENKALQVKQQQISLFASKLETEKNQSEILLLNQANQLKELQLAKNHEDLQKQQALDKANAAEIEIIKKDKKLKEQELEKQKLLRNIIVGSVVLLALIGLLLFNRYKLGKKMEKQQAVINERKRISTELHDDLGAQLSTARMFISNLKNNTNLPEKESMVENSLNILDSSINDLRNIMDDLHSSTLKEKSYIAAVEELVNKINQLRHINFILTHEGMNRRTEQKTEHHLFRITQELVNNTLKYADAKNVTIDLVVRENKIVLMYEDDGKGFNLQSISKGYGLKNIESRVHSIEGFVEFDSVSGKGSRTIIEVPLKYEVNA